MPGRERQEDARARLSRTRGQKPDAQLADETLASIMDGPSMIRLGIESRNLADARDFPEGVDAEDVAVEELRRARVDRRARASQPARG